MMRVMLAVVLIGSSTTAASETVRPSSGTIDWPGARLTVMTLPATEATVK